jgi:glutamate-1-semialdehyde 2,1-aminomutase
MSVSMPSLDAWTWLVVAATLVVVGIAGRALARLAAVLPAMAVVPALSRRLARWVHTRSYSPAELLAADGAGAALVERRREGLDRLETTLRQAYPQAGAWGRTLRDSFSDLRFTDASRVPFPFVRAMRDRFDLCSVVTASRGPYLQNLDGGWTLDVSGSYGLNVAGFDRYKDWIQKGWERVRDLGPVLGPIHPVVGDNIDRLKRLSHQDEVSFHMSGTEAVMAAVRLARFNTGRKRIVCFSGAYHGWWDGVQPGLGSERPIDDCLTLKDLHPASLRAIRRRAREIAAVLVNPVQAFHPNTPPPNDAVLLTSGVRTASASSERYALWLKALRDVCTACDVPVIFDEVYTGFRLAPGGAQEFFGVRADMVVYGKTVAGGMPIGVVCGPSRLMRRIDPRHPMRMAYVVGTFSAHPLVMGAMNEFLRWIEAPDTAEIYQRSNRRCAAWVNSTNTVLAREGLPLRVVNLGTVWTVLFKESSRYNWLLQYYLRAEGLTLSWVGTGRCLASMDFTLADYRSLHTKVVTAASHMQRDGWWPTVTELPHKDLIMRRRLLREVVDSLVPTPAPVRTFYAAVMKRKDDDHHASHNHALNQYIHLVSSSVFIYCYAILFMDLTRAMMLGLASLFVRQIGHAVIEPACHDEEALLLGYTTPNKTLIVLAYLAIPIVLIARAHAWSLSGVVSLADPIALQWFRWTLVVVLGRVAYLTWKHDLGIALIWLVKLVTDPFTDVVTYFPRRAQRA